MEVNFGDNSLQESEAAHEKCSLKWAKIVRDWEATNSNYEWAHF